MSKVITFSRNFPSYHPRKGEPTYFVEKIWKSLGGVRSEYTQSFMCEDFKKSIVWGYQMVEGVKHHTIRAGHRFKVGDWFSPRVWSGKPYNSKQIILAPDIQVKKVWDFEVYYRHNGKADLSFRFLNIPDVAKNDGLELVDFMHWFNKPFTGQIICWNESIEY